MGIGDWGLGIGDWGLGIGPNPQSPYRNVYLLGIDKNDNLTIYLKNKNKNCEKCIWNLILIKYLFFT